MKNIILTITVLCVTGLFAQSDYPIYKNVQFSEAFNWDKMNESDFLVPSPFAKPDLRIPKPIDFDKYDVKSITYYYSQNKSNPNFGQTKLSNERYEKLIATYPELVSKDIQWSTKVQNVCDNNECAEELFHGFVVSLQPKEKLVEEIKSPLGHDQLEDQSFRFKGEQENVIIGKDGTKILIPANAFVDGRGRVAQGNLTLKLKEAIHLEDIVLANLSTMTSSGEVLMSKGMIKVEAYKGKYALQLAKDKSLTIEVPTKFEEGYSYYKGENSKGDLTWTEPVPIEKNPQVNMNEVNMKKWGFKYTTKPYVEKVGDTDGLDSLVVHMWNRDVYFTKDDFSIESAVGSGVMAKVARKMEKWFKKNEFDFDDVANKFYGSAWYSSKLLPFLWKPMRWDGITTVRERDTSEVGNVLAMNELGWANIDCLARNKHTVYASFNVDLSGPEEMKDFSISLIVPSVNSMVPGFKRKNGNYSFTHGEQEDKVRMPLNEKVFVMASGISDGKQFFAINEYALGKKPVVDLEMREVSRSEMLEELKNTL